VPGNDSGTDRREAALVLFLVFVIIVTVLTILGPQIQSTVYNLTGR
jgi:hypothetical protein